MPNDKIVPLPSSALQRERDPQPVQTNLFGVDENNHGRIVFLHITWLSEESLLNLVVRNGVTALVDLRPRPVFDRPRFRHRHVVHYLFEQKIKYFEYAMISRSGQGSTAASPHWSEEASKSIRELLSKGLTVCLYDDDSRSVGWIDDLRHLMRSSPGYLAEVHPRALSGAPDTLGRR